jgi:hypothetical protein
MLLSIIVSTAYLLFWYYYHGWFSVVATLAVGVALYALSIPVNNLIDRKSCKLDLNGKNLK